MKNLDWISSLVALGAFFSSAVSFSTCQQPSSCSFSAPSPALKAGIALTPKDTPVHCSVLVFFGCIHVQILTPGVDIYCLTQKMLIKLHFETAQIFQWRKKTFTFIDTNQLCPHCCAVSGIAVGSFLKIILDMSTSYV